MPFERQHAPKLEELNQLFKNYRFDSLVSVGALAAIYLAEQINLERKVVVKILPRRYSRNEAFIEAFRNEAKLVAKLNHQHLSLVHDSGLAGEYLYLVMDYVEGESLESVIKKNTLSHVKGAELILKLCSGVRHAHDRGVVHRNIKPSNIILSEGGGLELVDFGLAKQCGYLPIKDSVEDKVTEGFVAPEVIAAGAKVDLRSDIYAIGATLCFIVTGYDPIDLTNLQSERRHLLGPLYSVVVKAIRTDPSHRYENVDQLIEGIYDALGDDDYLKQTQLQLLRSEGVISGEVVRAVDEVETTKHERIVTPKESSNTSKRGIYFCERYHLKECILQASKTMLYKAEDVHMNRIVMLRLFSAENPTEWEEDFNDILSKLSRVEHPNIPKILDGGMYDSGAFIVYGWERGEHLEELIGEELSYENHFSMALQILDALEVAGHYGFNHYALNPFSVMREDRHCMSGRYLLMDVGVSEVLSLLHADNSFLHGVLNEWAAPEQFSGRVEGEKTVLYSFAQMLITLILKGHILAGKSESSIAKMHEDGFKVNLLDYREDLHEDFVNWLHKLSRPDVNQRFVTIRDARKALPKRPKSSRL